MWFRWLGSAGACSDALTGRSSLQVMSSLLAVSLPAGSPRAESGIIKGYRGDKSSLRLVQGMETCNLPGPREMSPRYPQAP